MKLHTQINHQVDGIEREFKKFMKAPAVDWDYIYKFIGTKQAIMQQWTRVDGCECKLCYEHRTLN